MSLIKKDLNNLIVKWNLNRKLSSKLVIVFVVTIVYALISWNKFMAAHDFACTINV